MGIPVGETRFIVKGQYCSAKEIGEKKAMQVFHEKVNLAMEAAGYINIKEDTA